MDVGQTGSQALVLFSGVAVGRYVFAESSLVPAAGRTASFEASEAEGWDGEGQRPPAGRAGQILTLHLARWNLLSGPETFWSRFFCKAGGLNWLGGTKGLSDSHK